MEHRRLGAAGIKVSAISLGGWLTYGGSVEDNTAQQCVERAIQGGINFIDLADVYAGGESERVVGEAIKAYTRSDLVISSKVYWPMSDDVNDRGLSRKHIMESVDKSLARLQTDYLDIYFCHRYDPDTPLEETVRAMSDLVRAGKVLYWGTSVWEAAQLEEATAIAKAIGGVGPQVEQPRYNLLDRHIEAEVMPTVARLGIGLVVWSPLAQGILTGKYNTGERPVGSRAATSNWLDRELTEANIAKVRTLTTWANDHGYTPTQVALAWILQRPEISSVIIGASQPDQVDENLKALDVQLDAAAWAEVEKIIG